MKADRIEQVAHILYVEAYEAEFGGKDRGRFLVSREHLKALLGVQRLHPSTTEALIDACLTNGLVMIDMDDTFAFAETTFVSKWRKLPLRLVEEFTNQLDADEVDGDVALDDADEDETE